MNHHTKAIPLYFHFLLLTYNAHLPSDRSGLRCQIGRIDSMSLAEQNAHKGLNQDHIEGILSCFAFLMFI